VLLNVIYSISSYQGRFRKCLLTPPVVFFLKTMSGFLLFKRMPTASSSCSSSLRCSSDFVASSMMRITSAAFAAVCKVRLRPPFQQADKERRAMTHWKLLVCHDHGLGLHPQRYPEDQEVGFWHLYIRLHLVLPERLVNVEYRRDETKYRKSCKFVCSCF